MKVQNTTKSTNKSKKNNKNICDETNVNRVTLTIKNYENPLKNLVFQGESAKKRKKKATTKSWLLIYD